MTHRDTKKKSNSAGTDGHGEWIAAGFSGEGMTWAWLCGAAVGIMIAGSEEEELPAEPGSADVSHLADGV
jgi:glycine/D-amino acid oxidase-like deaminating enzyme